MKKIYSVNRLLTSILVSILLISFSKDVEAQTLNWANVVKGSYQYQPSMGPLNNYSAKDNAGNTYILLDYGSNMFVNFDASTNLSLNSGHGLFLAKYDVLGNLAWVKKINDSNSFLYCSGISTNASGEVYITGHFRGTVNFDPNSGIANISSFNNDKIAVFLAKYGTNGNYLWAKSIGTSIHDYYGGSIILDSSGNGYLSYTNNQSNILNISKYDLNGNLQWIKSTEKNGTYQVEINPYSLALDKFNNLYITGLFYGAIDFNPDSNNKNILTTYNTTDDLFFAKYDSDGNYLWAKHLPGSDRSGAAITTDALGNIYLAGAFYGEINFNPDPTATAVNLTSSNISSYLDSGNGFLAKYDTDGNYVWVKQMIGSDQESGGGFSGSSVNALGYIYLTGSFRGTVNFDLGNSNTSLTNSGYPSNAFLASYDALGNFKWVKDISGLKNDNFYGNFTHTDDLGNIYLTGVFDGTINLGSNTSFQSNGTSLFMAKYTDPTTTLPITLLSFEASKNNNDTYLSWETASEQGASKFEIERSDDGLVFNYIGEVKASGNSNSNKTYHFSDKNAGTAFPGKNLYYRFKQIDFDGKYSYSPVRSVKFEQKFVSANSQIQVYPNPADDVLHIQYPVNAYQKLEIRTITGEIALSKSVNLSGTDQINLSSLSSGIYILHLTGKEGSLEKKIVKL